MKVITKEQIKFNIQTVEPGKTYRRVVGSSESLFAVEHAQGYVFLSSLETGKHVILDQTVELYLVHGEFHEESYPS